jgi:hypothetical protein
MAWDQAYVTIDLADTLIAVWQGDPTSARVTALADEMRDLGQAYRSRIFLYNVITAATAMPSAEARDVLRMQFERMRGQLGAAAIVLEKLGIEGTLSRTVISTVLTISQRPFPLRVFPTRRDAANWLVSQGCRPEAAQILAEAEALEARLRAGPRGPLNSRAPGP